MGRDGSLWLSPLPFAGSLRSPTRDELETHLPVLFDPPTLKQAVDLNPCPHRGRQGHQMQDIPHDTSAWKLDDNLSQNHIGDQPGDHPGEDMQSARTGVPRSLWSNVPRNGKAGAIVPAFCWLDPPAPIHKLPVELTDCLEESHKPQHPKKTHPD